jgi:hypothetical protein
MTNIEAATLLGMIEGQSRLSPHLYQIGNGEWVIIVNTVWLWRCRDWDELKFQWHTFLYSRYR